MHEENILVIDTGSSSMRGIVIDRNGHILMMKQITNFMNIGKEGTAEQDCHSFRSCLIQICCAVSSACLLENLSLAAVCFTSQRSSVLPLDADGQPLSNIYMWYDKRSLHLCRKMDAECQRRIYHICGMTPAPILSAPKMLWLKEEKEEIYKASYKLTGIHDYLLYLCTGRFVTDISLASRTCLLDIHSKTWSDELIGLFGLDQRKLCDLILPGDIAGSITAGFSALTGLPQGLPVISSGGDQQCSLLGQSITEKGSIGITSGTGAYAAVLSDVPVLDKRMRLSMTVSVIPGHYVLEAGTPAAGSVYQWVKNTFYPGDSSYDYINGQVLLSQPGAGGLIMLPHLAGRGCSDLSSSDGGSFHHIGFHNQYCDFARAVLEGICAEIKECRDVLAEVTVLNGTVTSAGGLSCFPEYNQILSDMLNRPVVVCPTKETTAIGAWAVAAAGLGIYKNAQTAVHARKKMVSERGGTSSFLPQKRNTILYQKQETIRTSLRAGATPPAP